MGGSSGWLTSDSKEELEKSVRAWYNSCFSEGLYPRYNKKDFKKGYDFEKEGVKFITIQTDETEKVPIQIIKTEDIPEGFYKGHMRKKDLTKEFACFVSAHT